MATILDGLWKRLFEKDVAEQLHYNHTHFSRWLTDHIKNHCKIELDDHEAKYWFMKENMIEVNYDDLAAVPIMRETGLFTEQQFSELVLLESVLEMAACFNACTGCSRLQRRRELAVLQEALKVAETDEQLKEIEASINSLKTFYLSQGVVLEKTT